MISHPTLQPGDDCPLVVCDGRVYRLKKPQQIIRLYGQGLAHAVNYHLEQLRCNLCLTVFTAPLPSNAGPEKYTASFKAVLAVNHYYLGMPFYRLSRYHHYIGIPLPSSNQFACMESLVSAILPVYNHLLWLAAQGDQLNIDDTTVPIQSLIQANKKNTDKERKGMFSTAMIGDSDGHKINLIITGRQHAGENLSTLLKKRENSTNKMLLMCDALSRNLPTNAHMKKQLIVSFCLVHARRKFFECRDEYSDFCDAVLESFAAIYRHEAHCKIEQLSAIKRLAYHRKHSRPVMKALYRLCLDEWQKKNIEPKSSLGKAISYLIKHRRELTKFLRVAGAQLDNNEDEQLIKRVICYRKNSLSYKNEYGAFIGDVLMSLIFTTINTTGVNPVDYLTILQENRALLHQNPGDWLPWNYQATPHQTEHINAG